MEDKGARGTGSVGAGTWRVGHVDNGAKDPDSVGAGTWRVGHVGTGVGNGKLPELFFLS